MDNAKELDAIRTEIGITLIYSIQQLEAQAQKMEKLLRKQQQLMQQREAIELRAAELQQHITKLKAKARNLTEMIGDAWTIPQ